MFVQRGNAGTTGCHVLSCQQRGDTSPTLEGFASDAADCPAWQRQVSLDKDNVSLLLANNKHLVQRRATSEPRLDIWHF